jgi:hypothetical protein
MLCSHAYCAVIACDAQHSGARVANGLEVGGRSRRHALLRSPCAWGDESGDQQQQPRRSSIWRRAHLYDALPNNRRPISGFRDLPAIRRRGFHQRRRPGAGQHSFESSSQCWTHYGALSGRPLGRRLSRQCDRLFVEGCPPRPTHDFGSHHRQQWTRGQDDQWGPFHGAPRIHCATSGRASAQASTEAATAQARTSRRSAVIAAELWCDQRATSDNRSSNERATERLVQSSFRVDRSTGAA